MRMEEHRDREGFSKTVLSLTLQLRTLFEGFGGEEALRFLDRLGELSGAEQRAALEVFHKVLERLIASGVRFRDELDQQHREFEENLYGDLIANLKLLESKKGKKRLAVVSGGRAAREERAFMGRQLRRAQQGAEVKQFPSRPRRA